MSNSAAWTLQTHSLIGRTKEQEIIRDALQADGLRVIFFIGEAGIGKTRLLSEIPAIFKDAQVAFTDLIDLYHTDFHTISGIEWAIINSLDQGQVAFKGYREKRQLYEQWRKKGTWSEALESLYAELTPQFVHDLNEWSNQNQRVVLRFDTAELVQSEQEIHLLLAGMDEVSEVRGWLIKHIPELKNAVVILAGRPEGLLWDELEKSLGGVLKITPDSAMPDGWQAAKLISIRLGPLRQDDVPAYFAALAKGNERIREAQLTDEHYRAIYRVTGGRPLHLAFVATLITNRDLLPDALLADLDQGSDEQNRQRMFEAVWNLSPNIHAALPFVGWLRKGVDGILLSQVMTACLGKKWTPRRARQVLAELRRLPFVKTRGQLVFLHDEMYDLLDEYILNQDVKLEEKNKTCETAIAWYESRMKRLKEDSRHRQQLEVEQLYYRLLQDPDKGFEYFQERSDEALIGREVGFEMAMRDEVLRFFLAKGRRALVYDRQGQLNPRGRRIARDMGSRQVLRLLRRNKNQEARDLADKLWEYNQPPFERDGNYLFPCVLQIYRGEALAYLGEYDNAIGALKEAIERLAELEKEAAGPRRERVARMFKGLAYKNRGYTYVRKHQYDDAVKDYLAAIKIFEPLAKDMRPAQLDLAHVRRNLAFVYGEQGQLSDAQQECDKALEAFRSLGNRYGEALTQNVYGGIEYRFRHLHRSLARCQEALRLFGQIDDRRGIGLSRLWAGRASRKLGTAHTYDQQLQGQTYLQQAQKYIEEARDIFEKEINEPARLTEAIAEQGKLHRDWAAVLRRGGGQDQKMQENVQKAGELLQQAIARLNDISIERADYCHDLSDLYVEQQDYAEALAWLKKAAESVDSQCVLSPDRSATELNCPLPGYWEIMAKICASYGHIEWAQGNRQAAIEQWALAFIYLHLFSPGSGRFREEISRGIVAKLADVPSSELRELREHAQEIGKNYDFPPRQLLVELDGRIKLAELKESISV